MSKPRSIYTLAVQGGHLPLHEQPESAVPPIIASVGYLHESMEDTDRALGSPGGSSERLHDFVYARNGAPTQSAFEDAVAKLEGADVSVSFSSGMAALHAAVLAVISPGGIIIAADQLYGTTRTMLLWMAENMGITVHFADFLNPDAARQTIIDAKPQAVVCEVLTNPLSRVVRLDAIVDAANQCSAAVIVDNTFATPFLIRPLELGAALVAHSATKFINGHGDVLGGVVSGAPELMEKVRTHRRVLGGMLGAFDAWLALRGSRTFAVRMQQANQNAMQLARWLRTQNQISRVYYPGLESDPCHADATALFRPGTFGAMLAFDLSGADRATAFSFVESLQLMRPVTSLGDVTTLIAHPASASHRGLSPEARAAQGILEGTLRVSVGIEDVQDLIEDVSQALTAIH
jgi:cystathionine beta-lyase/cystathionine gamma-synthase